MGYCMNLREESFKIKKKNVAPCLKALKELANQTLKGTGFTIINGKKTKQQFAWVSTETFANAKTLKESLEEWRWDIEMKEDGSVDGISFSGEKIGDENHLFEAIAPYVESGSYIEMSGEDGLIWRWKFEKGKCTEEAAILDWDGNTQIVEALLKQERILPTLLGIHPALDRKIEKVLRQN